MNQQKSSARWFVNFALLLAITANVALMLAITGSESLAQGRGQRQQGGPPGGGPPDGGGAFGQRRGFGGPVGVSGGMVMGTIAGGDLNAGVITVQSQFGGENQTIRVNASTKVVTQQTATVADLKVGDEVQVQGVPTSITASSISAGSMPDFLGGGRGGPGGPGFGGQGAAGGPGGPDGEPGQGPGPGGFAGPGGPRGQAQSFASATGKITSINPLTISLSENISVVLKLASNARITRFVITALNKLNVGDRIIASGQPGNDGSFTAAGIGINMAMPGFGGPGGPGGFGPGGFGPGGQGRRGGGPRGPGSPDGPGGGS